MSFPSFPRSRRTVLAAALLTTGSLLAACGGGSGSGGGGGGSGSSGGGGGTKMVSQADIDKAMQTPTTLTFWTWVPNIAKEVALFEKKYPAIKVNVVNAGQGQPHYTKLQTALKAKTGAPDVAQMEFWYIPTFSLTKSLIDLRPYGVEADKDKFVPWTWGQVTGSKGEIWAVPQDTGPMGMLYRADIFAKYGLTPAKTWDQFAQQAKKLHAAAPNIYLTNMPNNEMGVWTGFAWQQGAKPFATKSQTELAINVNDSKAKALATYWQGLIKSGVVSTDPDFTDAWYQGLSRGKYATWLTAAWGPVFLSGTAKNTSGKWRAAPLPQYDPSKPASGNWGGSTTAVITGTKYPIAAAKFAEFLNTDPASTLMLATQQFLFPATKQVLENPAFSQQKPAFYGGQTVNKIFSDISNTVDPNFQWPPFATQAFSDWNETVGKSFSAQADVGAALDAWQQRLTGYAKNQGFKVSGQ